MVQNNLNYQLTQCVLDGETVVPCEYHVNRVNTTPYAIEGDVIRTTGKHTAVLIPHRDVRSLAKLFEDGKDPAGGWYLVKGQREWLEERLADVFSTHVSARRQEVRTVRVLEAGVASFVHHYTYLRVLSNVLEKVASDLRIALTVVDKCVYPILQIAVLERELARGLTRPTQLSVGGIRVPISKRFISVMDSDKRRFGSISTEIWVKDLCDVDDVAQLGCYDVITEHFLASVMDNRVGGGEIAATRETYSRILRRGGSLLVASGMTEGSKLYEEFVALHRVNDLRPVDSVTRAVWDPYSLSRAQLVSLCYEDEEVPVALENTLSMFVG